MKLLYSPCGTSPAYSEAASEILNFSSSDREKIVMEYFQQLFSTENLLPTSTDTFFGRSKYRMASPGAAHEVV